MRSFFDHVGDTKKTADTLHLHVNSVRHRIHRAQQIAAFSLDDPDERLLAELQVRLLT